MRGRDTRRHRRVLGYARVSSEEQALGTSLQDQQDAIKAYARSCGLEVTRFYVEAESAVYEKIEKRDQIRFLLKEVRSGDLVVCDKLDRWSRDAEFTYRSVRELLECGASFYAVADRCDPSTAEGDSALGLKILVAREEYKRIKERLVGTRKLLRNRGYYVEGLPPFGYKRALPRGQRGLNKNILQVEAAAAELVRDAYRKCVSGFSIGDIMSHLTRAYGQKSWDKKVIGTILRNRVYLGEVQDSHGVWIKGLHEAVVDLALFSKAQDALDGRRLGGAKSRDDSHTNGWILRGIARCAACGARMGSAYGTAYGKDDYIYYYRCTKRCGVRYVLVEDTERAALPMILERLVELRDAIAGGSESPPLAPVVDYEEKKTRLQAKRDRFLEAFADGDMSKEELRAALAKVDADRLKVEDAEAKQLVASPLKTSEVRRSILAHLDKMKLSWRKSKPEAKRAILKELATSVALERNKPPKFSWRSAEDLATDERQ